ncbi:MAG TPA: 2-phospho-L-lactate guanylyltransferase [Acidimicrobiia bacterium]|jgi:2-phospho-L-lactate guanylyltransferase
MSRAGVVVPIRSFSHAKLRLADHLSDEQRGELLRECAARVVEAAAPLPVVVVTSAPEVRAWARALGVDVVDDRDAGLDAAAHIGREHLATSGLARAVIAHADLPRAGAFAALGADGDRPIVTLVPCHRDDGTNVCSVPVALPFRFQYGEGSFRRHAAEARRLGAAVRVVRRADLAFDVDVPADLVDLEPASRP